MPPDTQTSSRERNRLESWKEIAEYLRREVRTVQRWEREQGLPVHRHAHHKRSSVYAFPLELDEWRNGREPEPQKAASRALWRRPAILAAGCVFVMGSALLAKWGWSTYRAAHTPFSKVEIQPLIATGNALVAAISPDGRYLAYVLSETAGQSLWIRDLGSGTGTQLITPSAATYARLDFSPDGSFLRFFSGGSLLQIPVLGGAPAKLAPGYFALSPDGNRVAFRRRMGGETSLWVANRDGSHERKLAARTAPDSLQGFAWSPDAKRIACIVGAAVFAGTDATVKAIDAESGKETLIAQRKWWSIDDVAWLPDGQGLLLVTREPPLKIFRPWYLSFSNGEAHPITNDLSDYTRVSPAGDSQSFVSVQEADVSSLWVAPAGDDGSARRITEGMRRRDGIGGLAWTPDGRIVYVSSFTGMMQIWISDADGRNPRRLSPEGVVNLNPQVCSNGRYIVYNSDAGPVGRHVWRMDLDGNGPLQLTRGPDESWPMCSPDSKWVMYISVTPQERTIMKVPIDGGAPVLITKEEVIMPSISPDGRTILATFSIGSTNRVVTMPWEGGHVKMLFAVERPKVHWSVDGKSILYASTKNGVRNIWSRSLAGGEPKAVTGFMDNEDIRWFAVSPKAPQVAVARGTVIRDVVRIQDLK
jgi:Tol biopolymer transport system component